MNAAIENLKTNQKQLDADGCMVGVSRQALEETFLLVDNLTAALEMCEAAYDADGSQQADAKHVAFRHPESDFLTLLNIWNTFETQKKHLSNSKLRKYCSDNFLSYIRMREWFDIHAQIMQVVRHIYIVRVQGPLLNRNEPFVERPGFKLLSLNATRSKTDSAGRHVLDFCRHWSDRRIQT